MDYILQKIKDCEFNNDPFQFIYIENFLEQHHFDEIIKSSQINLSPSKSFTDLAQNLEDSGWSSIRHAGTHGSFESYKNWRTLYEQNESNVKAAYPLCETAGIAFRLTTDSQICNELVEFFKSSEFISLCESKFNITANSPYTLQSGIHKYLTGYEISPHPDVREKALTWMLNLNTSAASVNSLYHTHFMKFIRERRYIYDIWKYYPTVQREWVPWTWAETSFFQSKNNSITIFKPAHDTLHAVKASYNDLAQQRTQLYGNIWYNDIFSSDYSSPYSKSPYTDYEFPRINNHEKISIRSKLNMIPTKIKKKIKARLQGLIF